MTSFHKMMNTNGFITPTFTTISFENPSCEDSCYANTTEQFKLNTLLGIFCGYFEHDKQIEESFCKKKCFKWQSVLTCSLVAVVIDVYWCSTVYLNIIKRYIITIYHTFVACAFIFAKENERANHLSQCSIRKPFFVPSAGVYNIRSTLLFVCILTM